MSTKLRTVASGQWIRNRSIFSRPSLDERLVERRQGSVVAQLVVVQLAGHEHVGRVRDPDAASALPDLLLVAVHLRSVDVPVADLPAHLRPPPKFQAGLIWNTPNPSCGISTPLFSETFGTALICELLFAFSLRSDVHQYYQYPIGSALCE